MSKILFIVLYEVQYTGTRLIASYLEENGHNTHTILLKNDCDAEVHEILEEHHAMQTVADGKIYKSSIDVNPITDKEFDLLKSCIAEYNPDIIGLTTRSLHKFILPQLMPVLTSFSPDTLLVAGGIGATLEPDFFLDAGFDVIVKGDGEEVLLEIVNAYKDKEKSLGIENTVWKTTNAGASRHGYKENPMRAMCTNLSPYPPPLMGNDHFSFIENDKLCSNFDRGKNTGHYTVTLGRGCVGECTYCNGSTLANLCRESGHPYIKRRNRSLESVFNELKNLNLEEYTYVGFPDEYNTTTNENLRKFFEWYKKEIGLQFFMYLHYEQIVKNPDLVPLAVSAGWDLTGIGIQTGSEEFARKYYNRINSNEIIMQYANLLYNYDITIEYQFIGGNCYETEEDFRKTINLIRQLPFSIADPRKTRLMNFRLYLLPKAPLLKAYPKVVTHPTPANEWLRKAMLTNLVRVLPETKFEEVYADKRYYADPLALQSIYLCELGKLQLAYYEELLEKWKDKCVAFYGVEDCLISNYAFFKRFNPECILLDKRFLKKKKRALNLPVYDVETFVVNNKDIHIICFSVFGTNMKHKLVNQLGMPRDQIEVCSHILPSIE